MYAATKHAAVGYAEWLSITYGDQGVKVSCVCPGVVDTDMGGAAPEATPARRRPPSAAARCSSPEDAAARILAGVAEDRFLIYTHPELQLYVERKAGDTDRWIRGMRRQWGRAQELLSS